MPDKSQRLQKGEIAKPCYLLWMLAEIGRWDDIDSIKKAVKAARWLAWIFRDLEIQGFIDNKETRAIFRLDTALNYDLPALFRE